MGGMGIFRVREDGLNLGSIIETLNRDGAQSVMVKNSSRRLPRATKRVLIVGGKPAILLCAHSSGGEVRGNLAAGGKGVAQPLSARDLEIAESLGPILWSAACCWLGWM